MSSDLKRAVEERRLQFRRFAQWEDEQLRAHAGPKSPGEQQRALDWYSDALEFATRYGGAGPDAPDSHLTDLLAWVHCWRRAWRAQ